MASTTRQSNPSMPYNTRKKSLSLSELGIIVPKRARAPSHPSPPSTVVEGEEPPVKKSKRSHGSGSPSLGQMSPPRSTTIRVKEEKPKRGLELSPPPSPVAEGDSKIDTEGISDDIVVGAIQQLEKTGNRPHLVKELAAVLATNNAAVEKSANPSALISSRLTAYLNRSWPAISPCPLGKDLSPVHPRRLYFYLTTIPRQPIPEHTDPVPKPTRIISPSLSSASSTHDPLTRPRAALSPSPEVDLSSPELDSDDPAASPNPPNHFSSSTRPSVPREHPPTTVNLAHNRRAVSPQLEREERDFKHTANLLHEAARLRRASEEDLRSRSASAGVESAPLDEQVAQSVEPSDAKSPDDASAAAELFEHADTFRPVPHATMMEFSSPLMAPLDRMATDDDAMGGVSGDEAVVEAVDFGSGEEVDGGLEEGRMVDVDAFAWDSLMAPEEIGVAELEDLFDKY